MNTPFELAFKYMPTPAFIIESATGKLMSYNRNFEILFENFNATPSSTWESLCEDAASPDDWLTLNKKSKTAALNAVKA